MTDLLQLRTERIPALDSMRGIAAFIVMSGHAAVAFDMINVFDGILGKLVRWTPLGLIFGGRQALLLFFVLSGYALSCAVIGDRAFTYPRFLIRRVCRIWLPYSATILLAAAVWYAVPPHTLPGKEAFINSPWPVTPDSRLILGHLAMTGLDSDLTLVPPAWSLIHEMRISAIFPLLLACCRWWLPAALAAATMLHVAAGAAIGCETWPCTPTSSRTIGDSILLTTYLIVFFILGIAIAAGRGWLDRRLGSAPMWLKASLWTGAIAALTLGYRAGVATDAVFGAASAVLIALVMVAPGAQRVLSWSPFAWLGRISYSLYLTHWLVMDVVTHLVHGVLPDAVILAVMLAGSLLVAAGMHRLVEAPALRLGKMLTRALVHKSRRLTS